MKPLIALKAGYPNMRFQRFDDYVLTKFKDLRVVISESNGVDTISLLRQRSMQKPTPEEIDEICNIFFRRGEKEQATVMPHPRYVHGTLIYRIQEGAYEQHRNMDSL